MKNYIIRLDDASDYMNVPNWEKVEKILDEFEIKPIFGIIPDNHDQSIVDKYPKNPAFWNLVEKWIKKGWIPAMHGYEHRYVSRDGGINPVNNKSEFAGLPYEMQSKKIEKGWIILKQHGIEPSIFFAPSHTFDLNTLKAIKEKTSIRIISDTIAWDIYKADDFYFIPQQSGRVRKLPFRTVTFCYHPNTMNDNDFEVLRLFICRNVSYFRNTWECKCAKKRTVMDKLLQKLYFIRKR